jgi:crossover junction endodeoxyribonuclease RuvC
MCFLGIDPGKMGGITIIKGNSNLSIEMPVTEEKELDILKIYTVITDFIKDDICVGIIEKSQSMKGQGVVSTFTYGKGYGVLLAILVIADVKFEEIRPTTWKRFFGLLKTTKLQSVELAEKFDKNQEFRTKRGRLMDGKAESYLLAEYGKRNFKKLNFNLSKEEKEIYNV